MHCHEGYTVQPPTGYQPMKWQKNSSNSCNNFWLVTVLVNNNLSMQADVFSVTSSETHSSFNIASVNLLSDDVQQSLLLSKAAYSFTFSFFFFCTRWVHPRKAAIINDSAITPVQGKTISHIRGGNNVWRGWWVDGKKGRTKNQVVK